MSDIDQYLRRLELSAPLREPIIRTISKTLPLPEGSRGLDAGCGIGLNTLLLAEAVGPAGHVTGLDIINEFLDKARCLASNSGVGNRVSFKVGDASKLPFNDNTFDWAYSMDFIGCAKLDPVLLLQEMARVVKPGGSIAVLIWSSQMLLPGYPRLEARLNATSSGIAPFAATMKPELHGLRALSWLARSGLINPTAQTFAQDICPPLSPEIRTALADLLQMRWQGAQSEVSPEDWAEYERLCQADSPDFILNVPDYYAFFTYSLFSGRVV